ncbi:MAG: LacI family transcriptional regulator [Ignavibacteriae bacterium HGW-Ignavibacteriae-2]|jgi:LacI family transcriptional regulator|nr:LacI family transcriptional regulator [Bacteroidota bacterium]PKL87078.1 MAG: LacI family transcriptional regulator [Ignavibacteriae bacterium HGW-Ignavibacteriae-2]
MAATIKEIAKIAKVSIATVSRALSNDPKVIEETKQLVLKVASDLNYNPNLLARNFVKRKSNLIGLILPDIADEFFSEIIRGVDDTALRSNYFTMVISSHKNRSLVESIQTLMGGGLAGGVIILIPYLSEDIKSALNNERIPFVIISGDNGLGSYSTISIDNYNAAYEMTQYLITQKNYTKIAFITGPADNNDAAIRQLAFKEACRNNGIRIKKSWIVEGNFSKESGEEACRKLIDSKDKPEAIFAANDMMALGCYEAIQSKGLKIPKDIGVVGFDDILLARFMNPPLTTVKVHINELGIMAAELLISKIENNNSSANRKIKVSSELVIRKSC